MTAIDIERSLKQLATPAKAKASAWFFKTGKGQYGEGDQFIGVTVPEQRKIARRFSELPLPEIKKLLASPIHEHRLTALFILVGQYGREKDEKRKKRIVDFYLKQRKRVNNWDLVDSSAAQILGDWLLHRDPRPLQYLAASTNLWERRIGIIGTFPFIRAKRFELTLDIAELLLTDPHDLIHKAVGWMLREVGKQDEAVLRGFLDEHATTMPRTMLRYAIEKFAPVERRAYLGKRK